MRKPYFISQRKKKPKGGIFFSMEYHFYWSLGGPCFEFFKDGNDGLFEPKSSWQYDIYWLPKNFCFARFLGLVNTVFFETKNWWKDDIYWLLKIFCFELFSDEKYGLFSQKVDVKIILGLFELSMILQNLGNTVLRAVKSWNFFGFFTENFNKIKKIKKSFHWKFNASLPGTHYTGANTDPSSKRNIIFDKLPNGKQIGRFLTCGSLALGV